MVRQSVRLDFICLSESVRVRARHVTVLGAAEGIQSMLTICQHIHTVSDLIRSQRGGRGGAGEGRSWPSLLRFTLDGNQM